MKIDDYQVSAQWVDKCDDSWRYKDYTDAKLGANWLEKHIYVSKYCLQITKCDDSDCCRPLRTNIQNVLKGKFLPTPLSFGKGATLLDPKKKDEKTRLRGLYESLALQHLRPPNYPLCEQLPYDLYCPSSKDNDPEYVCAYCRKICTTKALLKIHLKATLHHSYILEDDFEDEVEEEVAIPDGPCLIPEMKIFCMGAFEVTYE